MQREHLPCVSCEYLPGWLATCPRGPRTSATFAYLMRMCRVAQACLPRYSCLPSHASTSQQTCFASQSERSGGMFARHLGTTLAPDGGGTEADENRWHGSEVHATESRKPARGHP